MFVYYYKYFPKMKLASKLTCFCDVIRQTLRLAEHTTKPLYFIGPYLALEVGAVVEAFAAKTLAQPCHRHTFSIPPHGMVPGQRAKLYQG